MFKFMFFRGNSTTILNIHNAYTYLLQNAMQKPLNYDWLYLFHVSPWVLVKIIKHGGQINHLDIEIT